MLVRASLISALLLSLYAEAGAADQAKNQGKSPISGGSPENAQPRATTAEDLFAQPMPPKAGGLPIPAANPSLSPALTAEPAKPALIRSGKQKVDESGLRYFASQNQQKRVEKEIQRLKALYPDWTPPDDLFLGPPGGPDEQPFWDLFAVDKLEELRALIAERMKVEPNWKPSPALIYKLERKETRIKLVAAYDAKNWRKVIEVAAADPKVMVCADIDVPWRVAEAFSQIGQKAQTFEVYRFLLTNCRDRQTRMTTLKKSLAYFEPREVDVLVAMGARNDDGTSEFDDVRIELLRTQIGKAAASNTTVSDNDLRFYEASARKKQLSADLSNLGWYLSSRKNWTGAAASFKLALELPVQNSEDGKVLEEPAKMAEGYINALRNLEKYDEAEPLAFTWGTRSDAIRAMYLDIVGEALLKADPATEVAAERIERYKLLVSKGQSVFGTQALGWYYFNRQKWADAIPWFQSSLSWSESGKEDTTTAEGLAVALRNAFRFDEAEELAYRWRERASSMRALYIDIFAESLVRQSAPITFSEERIARYSKEIMADQSGIGAQGLAWYHYDRTQWADAARWFRLAMDWTDGGRGNEKLAEGLAQSLRQDKQYDKAVDLAFDWHEVSPTLKQLFVDISAEHLVTLPVEQTYETRRLNRFASYVNETKSTPGAEAIAWYLYNRKTYAEAVRWFKKALDLKPNAERELKLVEGFALALRYVGSVAEAEDLAYDWRERSPALRKAYVEIAAEAISTLKPPAIAPADRMERFVAFTEAEKSSFGAQSIGWYHHQRGEFDTAAKWFNTSIDWGGEITDAKTAQGYLLALISLGRMEEADKLAFEWHERSDEFRNLYIDVFGGAILRALPPQSFPTEMLKRYEYIAAYGRSVFGSQAIAWYYYDRQNWQDASRWFQASLDWSGEAHHDQKTVEGFAQAIRYLALREEAEDILYAWRDKNPLLRKLYIELFSEGLVNTSAPIFFSDERLDRYAKVILEDKDWFGAQGLAWYRHDRRQWADAVRWFKYAREWSKEALGDAKMAEGLAFSLRNLDLYDESEFVSVEWKDKSPALRKLYSETVGEYLVRMKPEFTYPNDRMERYLETVIEDRNNIGAQSAGWYYYAREMYDPAAQWLYQSLVWGPDVVRDPKTAEGYITALRLGGRLAEAEAAAFEWFDKSPELRALYFDIASELLATIKPPAVFPAERLARYAEMAVENRSTKAAIALGWYAQGREDWQGSVLWFERALEWDPETPDIKAVEGYAIALVGLGRFEDAENLVFKWRERSDRIAALYIDVFGAKLISYPRDSVVDPARLERYALLVGAEKSVYGAQALAWYNYDRRIWAESARWFEANLKWAGDGNHDQKSIEGFAQSLRYIGRREEAEDLLYAWRDKNGTLRKLYVEIMAEGLVSTSNPVFFSDERLDRFGKLVLEDRDWFGAQGLAWYRHDRRQWPDAVRWFKYAREWSEDGKGDAKMAEGLAFSLRNLDLYDESEFVSVEWKDRAPAMRKLYSETVGEYLVRMKPEVTYPNDRMERYLETVSIDRNNIGAQSAGWYYYAREMYDPAAQWFLASLQWGPDVVRDPKTAEGYVTSLRLSGRLIEAEAAAFDLRERSPALAAMYFDIAAQVLGEIKPPNTFPADRLARFAELAFNAKSVPGAQALAWYHQSREEWSEAVYWFEQSLAWGGDANEPKAAEGMLVALVGLGRFEEAENLVHSWRASNPQFATLYLDIFGASLLKMPANASLDPERLDRFGVIVGLEKSAFGAQSLAWYFSERQNWTEAAKWFQASLGWTTDGKFDAKSIEGFAQALRYSGRREEAEELLFQWRDSAAGLRKLYIEAFAEGLINQSAPITFADYRIDRFADVTLTDRSSFAAQALGWYRYNRRSWADAARWFKNARAWSSDGKGDAKLAEGLAFSLRNMDLYDESETVSWEWRDRSPPVRKLYTETVAEYLVRLKDENAYPIDRLSRFQAIVAADKSSIGAQAIGWYFHARGRYGEAVPWFRNALDWGPDPVRDPKTAEGLAIALRNGGSLEEAELFAYSWRDRSDNMRTIYFDIAGQAMGRITPPASYPSDRLARYITMTQALKSPTGALAIGWYRANRKDWPEAVAWFKQASDWQGDPKDVNILEGYVFALRNAGRLDEAESLALTWRESSPRMNQQYLEMLAEAMVKLDDKENFTPERLNRFAQAVTERQWIPGAQALGWYMLNRKQNAEGETWFRNALAWSGDNKDIALLEGFAVSQKRQFKYAEADQIAYDILDKSEMARELYRLNWIEWLVKTKAPATVPADRFRKFIEFTTNRKVATAARTLGWYYYDRKDWPQALTWFKNGTDWETDPANTKGPEGYVLTLKNMGKPEEAENFAYEWREKSPEMRSLYVDTVPQLISAVGETGTFPVERLNRFATQVTATKSAYGAQSIAWYKYQRKDYAGAIGWFKSALDWSGDAKDPKLAEGYALALRSGGRLDEAETIAYEWRERADSLRTLYIDTFAEALTKTNPPPPFAPERLGRFAAVTSADKSATGAQALGWYSFNIKQYRPARAWFEKSMQWAPTEGSALGLALAARSMNDKAGFETILNTYRGTYPKLVEMLSPQPAVQAPAGSQVMASAPQPQVVITQPAPATRTVRGRPVRDVTPRASAPDTGGSGGGRGGNCHSGLDSVALGWCLLNANRPQEAAIAFERGRNGSKAGDAAYGEALSHLRSGETDEGARAAASGRLNQKQRNDVGVQVLTQRIVAAQRAGRHYEALRLLDERGAYATETRDMAMLRGWALYNVGRKDAARAIFTELDRQLSTKDTQSALGVVNEIRGN